ncbi:ankyrin, partial [Cenococcum geophilum 1.58]|uniref:ankyrin n=1 Tax=Cenococcum geophilum 1.58 TaxID=794803 RepID=UPI00358E5911
MQLYGVDALTIATETGNEYIVKMLLVKGANVHGTGKPASPIITAAMRGFGAILTMLIEYGADVNVSNELYGTPLISAASRGHIDIVPILLRYGAIVDCFSQHHGTPLIAAAAAGHMKVAALLMDCGADLARADEWDSSGELPPLPSYLRLWRKATKQQKYASIRDLFRDLDKDTAREYLKDVCFQW